MIEAAIQGIIAAFSLSVLPYALGGIFLGLLFGIIPGIGVVSIMAIMLPLTYGMSADAALSLLLAIHAVGCTGGSISSILINIPGTSLNAATLLDGYPMTKNGQAGRAIAAALTSSALGGVLGGLIFLALIPVSRAIVMSFGSPESFLIALVGLAFLAVLSKGSTLKGLASGFLGILLSFVGMKGITSVPRFTFDFVALYDGIPLLPVVIGLFAFPEVIQFAISGKSIVNVDEANMAAASDRKQIIEGMKDIFRHWKVFITSSILGCVIGVVPGVGGETACFVAYAQAKRSSKHPERFGQGTVEGVIAPEAANNAKEGGSMLPTLSFGIPGSALMAVIMGGFLIHGITPGPGFLVDHLDLTFCLLATLIFSNVFGAIVLFPIISTVTKVCFVPGSIMAPLIVIIAAFGGYVADNSFMSMAMTFIIGGIGWVMAKFGYDRVCLLLGYILGNIIEKYLYISLSAYGTWFLIQPIPIFLEFLFLFVLFYDSLKGVISRRRRRMAHG